MLISLKIAVFRTPTPQDVWKKGTCFTFAMTNTLVVIIKVVKVPKLKKILLYEMKFLTSASRTPD